MSFGEAVSSVLSNYANFSGRARRSEYWYFVLFNIIVTTVLNMITRAIPLLGFVSGIYGLAVIVPALAVGVRRLHDIGKSGWWMLITLVPLVGSIILLIWEVRDSEPGDNQYGPNPKGMQDWSI